MAKRKFDHFETFKVVFTILYLVSGLFIFGTLASNATKFNIESSEVEDIRNCNCDEVD